MLAVGTQLDPYRIVAPLGAGGMGEVYLAEDTRLGRKIALKLLPAQFAVDAERVRRFVQEAKAASALDHPNILSVHDIGTHNGLPYIVSELLEGETLRDRLNTGAPPVRKAVDCGLQIAHGLAAAHGKGIIHRDLKPENLFICHDGRVKILDFGLAKLKQTSGPGRLGVKVGVEHPTETYNQSLGTDPGKVMGTVGYMAPEQVRGQESDHRTDIFAVGVVLYEMLAGKRAFAGQSAVETMNAILKEEPPELAEINDKIAPGLVRVVSHCLEKNPQQRFQSASDLAFALEALSGISGSTSALSTTAPEQTRKQKPFAWILATVALALAVLSLLPFTITHLRNVPPEERVMKFSILPPEKASLGSFAISPDGRWLTFTATKGGNTQLWVRALDALTVRELPGTEGASYPFWSPDSRFIGFFASRNLKKVEASGSPVQTLCNAGLSVGGTWSRDGAIVFGGIGSGLYRASANEGSASLIMPLDLARHEVVYQSPTFLPDGHHFLYFIWSDRKDVRGVYLGSLDGTVKRKLLSADSNVVYVEPGYLLFGREGALLAQPFDAKQLTLTGVPLPLAEEVGRDPDWGRASFSVSGDGVLVYDPSLNRQRKQLVWVDRQGKQIRSLGSVGGYGKPQLSPDERRVVVARYDIQTDSASLWLYDAGSGGGSRFTFDAAVINPVWSPDGNHIVWGTNRAGVYDLYRKAASGAGPEELLLKTSKIKSANDWSLDGRFLIYAEVDPTTKTDLWVLPLFGDRKPFPFLQTESNESGAQLSPDGRWMAYTSDETGVNEVYVRSFPSPGGKWQVSTKGGTLPHWRRDGKELFYGSADGKLMAVEVKADPPDGIQGARFERGAPQALFEFRSETLTSTFTVTADGQRFLLNTMVDESGGAPLTVVVNWMAGLKR